MVEEVDTAYSADATSGELSITTGPYCDTDEYLGGMTIIDVVAREVISAIHSK